MTVAHTLSVISYHIIANPEIQQKLHKELDAAFPDSGPPVSWGSLEQLPYLVSAPSKDKDSRTLSSAYTH